MIDHLEIFARKLSWQFTRQISVILNRNHSRGSRQQHARHRPQPRADLHHCFAQGLSLSKGEGAINNRLKREAISQPMLAKFFFGHISGSREYCRRTGYVCSLHRYRSVQTHFGIYEPSLPLNFAHVYATTPTNTDQSIHTIRNQAEC